jgi:hypothetical protein
MKRVRYLVGAAGALAVTPALGAFTPALTPAAEAAVTAQAASHSGKTVSLNQPASPAVSRCGFLSNLSAVTGKGVNIFQGEAFFSNPTGQCVDYTKGDLHHSQTGLEMRTRLYRKHNMVYHGYVHGHANPFSTYFSAQPRVVASQACVALVYSSDTAKVAYGPACINIPK